MKAIVVILGLVMSMQCFAAGDDDWEPRRSRRAKKGGSSSMALGFSSNSQLLQRGETALSGLFSVGRKGEVQAFFMLPSSDPNLYSIGALYKYVMSGSKKLGFHVGGGFGMGDYAQDLGFTRIMANAGFRFTVQKRIQIHVDGGLTIQDDEPGDGQTTIQGNSSIFGLSLLYRL